jgi:hypothetical protein
MRSLPGKQRIEPAHTTGGAIVVFGRGGKEMWTEVRRVACEVLLMLMLLLVVLLLVLLVLLKEERELLGECRWGSRRCEQALGLLLLLLLTLVRMLLRSHLTPQLHPVCIEGLECERIDLRETFEPIQSRTSTVDIRAVITHIRQRHIQRWVDILLQHSNAIPSA